MDPHGLCDGCHRTLDEIATWSQLDEGRRAHLMDVVLPGRAGATHGHGTDPGPGALTRLQAALLPLGAEPAGPGWNLEELDGLLPARLEPAAAAVLVPLVQRREIQVLLTRRNAGLRQHAGQVSFPGGRIDATDDGPVSAALREAREEIGLGRRQARVLGFLDPLLTVTGFRVVPVVAEVQASFVAKPEPGEVDEVFEVPLDWLMARDNLQAVTMEFGGRRREVLEFRRHPGAPSQRIWGVTASILFNLRQRLAGMAS